MAFPISTRPIQREIVGRVSRVASSVVAALRAWATPDENPFLQRALRVEARKHKPFLTVFIVAFLIGAALVAVWRGWIYLDSLPETAANIEVQKWFFDVFGNNPISWIAIATAAVSASAIAWCARARAAYLLRQETLKNTLVQLQQLPLAEERWVWLLSAHPASLGILIGAIGLPIYALAVFVGQWSALDVAALFAVFFLTGHVLPTWQPVLWQQASDKKPPKTNWRAWRESLAMQPDAVASEAQKLEAARRTGRALTGDGLEYSRPQLEKNSSQSGAPIWGAVLPTRQKNARGWSVFRWLCAGFFFFNTFAAAFGGAGVLTASWPREATALLPAFPVTWPLFVARMLVAPIDFFAFALPPFLLLIPLWIALSHQNFVTLAANVSAAETFWTPARARRKSRIQIFIRLVIGVFILGYGWPLLMESALLARLLPGAPVTPQWAEAGLFSLLMVAATIIAGSMLEAPFKRALDATLQDEDQISTRVAFIESARSVIAAPLLALGAYFLFCALGARGGLSAPSLARMPLVVFTIIAFLLADLGGAALGATLSGARKRWWRAVGSIWFVWLGLSVFVYVILAGRENRAFAFDDAPHVLLSPFVTLLSLFRHHAPLAPGADTRFWGALCFQAFVGAACLIIAAHRIFGAAQSTPERAQGAESAREEIPFWKRIFAPLIALERIALALLNAFFSSLSRAIQKFNSLNEKIVRAGEKWDNAVLTFELRRRAPKENWALAWLALFLIGAFFFLFCARPWELWTIGAQGGGTFSGASGSWNFFAGWGAQVSIITLVAMWGAGALAAISIGRAFDADRANGTLIFLFLTPQTDRQILIGKLMANAVFIAGWISGGLVWLGLGIVVGTIFGRDATLPFVVLSGVLALAASLLFIAAVNLFFAVRARKPTEGQSRALLCCIVLEAGAILGFMMLNAYLVRNLNVQEEMVACPLLIACAFVHLIFALGAWHLALHAFAKRRYGDVEASGKGAS